MVASEASGAQTGTLENYNAAVDLIERNLAARPDKIAYIDDSGRYSFADLAERVNRCASALVGLGLNRIGRVKDVPDTPQTRGMIAKVAHLLRVVEK